MILKKLTLENFRLFKGIQEIEFASNSEKNVTIVHAENGFGKTTLLSSLLWGFFGQRGLEGDGYISNITSPENLIHEGEVLECQNPEELSTSVEILFSDHDIDYTLKRSISLNQQNNNPKKTDLKLSSVRGSQTYEADGNLEIEVEKIILKDISRYLFFQGERILTLAQRNSQSDVKKAIREMLGLSLIESAIEDLKHNSVIAQFNNEWRNNAPKELQGLIDKKIKKEEEKKKQLKEFGEIEINIKDYEKEIELTKSKLKQIEEVAKQQQEREKLQKSQKVIENELEETERELKLLIADEGYKLFTERLVDKGKEIIEALQTANQIPAQVQDKFLNDLLDRKSCICGRDLSDNSRESGLVKQLLQNAGDLKFTTAVSALERAVEHLDNGFKNVEKRFKELVKQRTQKKVNIDEIKGKIIDIGKDIGTRENQEIAELESFLEKNKENIRIEIHEQGMLTESMGKLAEEIHEVGKEIDDVEAKSSISKIAQKRVEAIEKCINTFEKILEEESNFLIPLLDKKINETFGKIIRKDYQANLTDDFEMRITKIVPTDKGENKLDVAASDGELQIAALVFISSLLALSEKRTEIKTVVKGLRSNIYPLVIDAPFGQLGKDFRKGISKYVPELAPQVIILLSPTHYDNDVETVLKNSGRIGKRYYLHYHGKVKADLSPNIEIDNKQYQHFTHIDKPEYTIIEKLDI